MILKCPLDYPSGPDLIGEGGFPREPHALPCLGEAAMPSAPVAGETTCPHCGGPRDPLPRPPEEPHARGYRCPRGRRDWRLAGVLRPGGAAGHKIRQGREWRNRPIVPQLPRGTPRVADGLGVSAWSSLLLS